MLNFPLVKYIHHYFICQCNQAIYLLAQYSNKLQLTKTPLRHWDHRFHYPKSLVVLACNLLRECLRLCRWHRLENLLVLTHYFWRVKTKYYEILFRIILCYLGNRIWWSGSMESIAFVALCLLAHFRCIYDHNKLLSSHIAILLGVNQSNSSSSGSR